MSTNAILRGGNGENVFSGLFGKLGPKKVILLNFGIDGSTLDLKSWTLQVSESASGLLDVFKCICVKC